MIKAIASWLMALWTCFIFLSSLPYKFTKHPDTQHIFGTIGKWMSDTINMGLGEIFANIGSYVVGGFELVTSLVLLLPALIWAARKVPGGVVEGIRARWHAIGGLLAAGVMSGAIFFHLFTPLGIEVIHEGEGDGGSLFKAAVSILIFGLVLFAINVGGFRAKNQS